MKPQRGKSLLLASVAAVSCRGNDVQLSVSCCSGGGGGGRGDGDSGGSSDGGDDGGGGGGGGGVDGGGGGGGGGGGNGSFNLDPSHSQNRLTCAYVHAWP